MAAVAFPLVIVLGRSSHPASGTSPNAGSSSPSAGSSSLDTYGPDVPGNGTVLWKATSYRMADGWGTNLAGRGMRVQIYPGTSADLEVDSGYLSAGGHIAFLPRGTPTTYQSCQWYVLRPTSTQSVALTAITPGVHGDLCSSGSAGEIAFIHVTRNDGSALTMDITIWQDI
jgi:hypothetical protein